MKVYGSRIAVYDVGEKLPMQRDEERLKYDVILSAIGKEDFYFTERLTLTGLNAYVGLLENGVTPRGESEVLLQDCNVDETLLVKLTESEIILWGMLF